MKPVTVQPLKFPPISMPSCPRRRIYLHDFNAVALPHKTDAVVVAERMRKPLDELIQLDLSGHQVVKCTQPVKRSTGVALATLKQDGAKMSDQRSSNIVLRQLQRGRLSTF